MDNGAVIATGRFFFYHRNWVFPILILAVFALRAPLQGTIGAVLDLFGLLAVVAGLLVRLTVISTTPVKRDGDEKRVDAVDLKTTGLFAACRNPLYVGNMLIASGYFLIHGDLAVIVLGIGLTFLIYQAIIANEEAFLRERFADAYVAYLAQNPRWWPRIGRLRGAFEAVRVDLASGLRTERSVIMIATVISALAFWYQAAGAGVPAMSWIILVLGSLVALIGQAQPRKPV